MSQYEYADQIQRQQLHRIWELCRYMVFRTGFLVRLFFDLCRGVKGFVRNRVPSFVLALVDISLFPQSVPEVLDCHCMLRLRGPDVGGVADIGGVKELTEPFGDLVAQLDLRDTCLLGCLLDLVIQGNVSVSRH